MRAEVSIPTRQSAAETDGAVGGRRFPDTEAPGLPPDSTGDGLAGGAAVQNGHRRSRLVKGPHAVWPQWPCQHGLVCIPPRVLSRIPPETESPVRRLGGRAGAPGRPPRLQILKLYDIPLNIATIAHSFGVAYTSIAPSLP